MIRQCKVCGSQNNLLTNRQRCVKCAKIENQLRYKKENNIIIDDALLKNLINEQYKEESDEKRMEIQSSFKKFIQKNSCPFTTGEKMRKRIVEIIPRNIDKKIKQEIQNIIRNSNFCQSNKISEVSNNALKEVFQLLNNIKKKKTLKREEKTVINEIIVEIKQNPEDFLINGDCRQTINTKVKNLLLIYHPDKNLNNPDYRIVKEYSEIVELLGKLTNLLK